MINEKTLIKRKKSMKCVYCSKELEGCNLDVGEGNFAHPFCYWRLHPFQKRKTFREVLANRDDQVLVFDLLEIMIDDATKYKVVESFNQIMEKRKKLELNPNTENP